jgi:hypothetical protein
MKKGVLTMSHRWMVGCALILGALLAVNAGCWGRGQERVKPPPIDAAAAGAEAIKMYDTNKDGMISGAELDKCPAVKAALAKIDTSGKGEVTADMITARVRKWQESRLGKMSLGCSVTRNGQPLEGATVTFVPEKFLGDKVPKATGKTDSHGMAMLSVAVGTSSTGRREPPGVAPGLYRVVITKAGMDIPPQYSTEAGTILGQEVAMDAKGIQEGIKFNLKF